jgi:hypothetical protein
MKKIVNTKNKLDNETENSAKTILVKLKFIEKQIDF